MGHFKFHCGIGPMARPGSNPAFIVSFIPSWAGLLLEIDQYFHMHSQAAWNTWIWKTQSTVHVSDLTSDRFRLLAIIQNRLLPCWGSPAINGAILANLQRTPLELSRVIVLQETHLQLYKIMFPWLLTLFQAPPTWFPYVSDFQVENS